MSKRSFWFGLSALLVALASFACAGCGSDKTGTTGNALTDCDAGDGGSCSASTTPTGGW
jgi:hypothetical protein